jgi:tellurite methyltransferase
MDKNYWRDYYSKQREERLPSLFAKHLVENYLNDKDVTLIELGCGNGRDSIYFSDKGIKVIAIDQVEEEIDYLRNKYSDSKNLEFISGDFTNFEDDRKFNVVYSRFTMHSINASQQDRVLKWSFDHLEQDGLLCIEVRGKKNEIFKKGEKVTGEEDAYIFENHYRRFLDFNELCNQLKEIGYSLIYCQEDKGFAPFKNTNETFIRVIAKK